MSTRANDEHLRSSATRLQSSDGFVVDDGIVGGLVLPLVAAAARNGAQVSLLNISRHASYSASVALLLYIMEWVTNNIATNHTISRDDADRCIC